MTEDVTPTAEVVETSPIPTDPIELIKMLEEKDRELAAVKAHKQELLDETKRAKLRAQEAAEEKARLKEASLREKGEFEQLYKSASQREETLRAELKMRDERQAQELTKNAAMKLATQLADGHNAELLAEFIQKRLKYTDEGLRVLDVHGGVTVSQPDDLKNEFLNSEKFKSLIRGSKATGGGASGTSVGNASASLVDKAVFDTWTPKQKMEFSLKGGRVK